MTAGDGVKTHDRAVQATVDMIEQQGWNDVSLRGVASQLGISAPALYRHFKDKDDLMRQTLVAVSHIAWEDIEAAAEGIEDPQERLLILAEKIIQTSDTRRHLVDFLFFSPYAIDAYRGRVDDPEDYPLLREAKALIAKVFAETDTVLSMDEAMTILWSVLQGYCMLVINGLATYNRFTLERTLDALTVGWDDMGEKKAKMKKKARAAAK